MWLMLCWLVGLPKLFYHFVLTLPVLILFLFYKLFGGTPSSKTNPNTIISNHDRNSTWPTGWVLSQHRQEQFSDLQRRQQHLAGQVRDKMRLVMTRSMRTLSRTAAAATATVGAGNQSDGASRQSLAIGRGGQRQRNDMRCYYLASLLVVGLICVASHWPVGSHCLEQDAEMLTPVAGLAKSIIKTVTLGVPLEINFDPSGLVKNFSYFIWRTGFPVSMPKGFMQKVQDFYNRVKLRVDWSEVKDVERKSLVGLKSELDEIVDSIVDEVRQSSDGLYTDYLRTRVNGVPLEDACTAVGVQLKAYGVDLTNYRNIAGMVLGIPVMPTVASTMMNVANLASLDTMRNLTQAFGPLNTTTLFLAQLPGNAIQSVSSVSNSALSSIGSLGQTAASMPLGLFRQQLAMPPAAAAAAAAA